MGVASVKREGSHEEAKGESLPDAERRLEFAVA